MDSKEITTILGRQLFESGHTPICANFQTMALHECDIISVNSNDYLSEFEIKISASDFKADFKKTAKHKTLKNGPFVRVNKKGEVTHLACSYFWYVCPACLIREDQVPSYAGLIWIHENGRIDTKIKAPLLHKIKADSKIIKKIAHNLTQKHLFGSSYMTLQGKEQKEDKIRQAEIRKQGLFNNLLTTQYYNPERFKLFMSQEHYQNMYEEGKKAYPEVYAEHVKFMEEEARKKQETKPEIPASFTTPITTPKSLDAKPVTPPKKQETTTQIPETVPEPKKGRQLVKKSKK